MTPRRAGAFIIGLTVVGIALAMFGRAAAPAATPVRVGSKSFTESYVVAEIVARVIEEVSEASVERRFGLGGTGIAFGALASGEIDVYPEYTGTISRAILKDASVTTIDALRSRLRPLGLTISDPLGFANTYALAVARATATRLGLRTISDLARHPGLTAAFDPGFIDRDDGWRGLRRHYGLPLTRVTGMEHALTYQAVASGHVDVIDVFSTDGQLARYDLVVLEDDRHFFPQYAVAIGLPLGLVAARHRVVGQVELMSVGVLQTIPALALLAFMIPLFGIGRVPALVALSLYALLPIVRNTYAGVSSLDRQLVDMAAVMQLGRWQRLAWIELPLASVTIMAGIKTAAVLTVGTATLAAFIGGGGYGTLIVTGLALNDVRMILAGAIPAALMALAIHVAFEALDRLVVPRPLRGARGTA